MLTNYQADSGAFSPSTKRSRCVSATESVTDRPRPRFLLAIAFLHQPNIGGDGLRHDRTWIRATWRRLAAEESRDLPLALSSVLIQGFRIEEHILG